jgi:hypothetical protein
MDMDDVQVARDKQLAEWSAWLSDEMAAKRLVLAIVQAGRSVSARVMVAALEDFCAGTPECDHFFSNLRADSEWWGDIATPAEIEAFTAAGLRRITRKADFGIAARKRLLVELWNSMVKEDQRKFLAAVDPNGQFQGRAA